MYEGEFFEKFSILNDNRQEGKVNHKFFKI